ncbi:putative type 4 fimbrial biogenesis transmembrane protein [Acidovorax sp. NO-1]|uniref:type IV pilin protein n=1 Tax=Acidovorax sp. NO-1 TaxID=512030 RepID=UPI00023FC822|nr:type IV pilin protein [Acidovorax sp. NO-1]EHL21142.1 putative type 4 fimbrial biogenesis transmembrane protein [Acidovorax sp. NO-1]
MRRNAGFTLIELMITVAVVSILAAIAYPSYQDQVRKSRRAEAQSLLMDIGTRQQQRLLDVRNYAASTAELNVSIPTSVIPHYAITMVAPASTPPSFTVTATPKSGQSKDKCGAMTLNNTGAKTPATGCW